MPGGVCAVLDYDVEPMAEYVAEMATRLAYGDIGVPTSFRKFVSQILTSTRLPSTTIMLGMNYLAKRINMMNMGAASPRKLSEGQLWRMLTTAFLLGSKFLDDNTFQNRSWSEVSGIAVQELNTLEQEWLAAIEWSLYVNLDKSKDYNAWLKSWKDWQDNKKRQQAQAARERLMPVVPPIDTDVHRSRNQPYAVSLWHQQQVAEYERLSNLNKRNDNSPQGSVGSHGSCASHESWRSGPWSTAGSQVAFGHVPMTPPDSGYGTPEYLNSATLNSAAATHNAQYNEWFSRGLSTGGYSRPNQFRQQPQPQPQPQPQQPVQVQQHQVATHRSSYHAGRSAPPGYYGFGHSIWDPNVPDCKCSSCVGPVMGKPAPYGFGMAHGYGQPVMG